MEFDKVFNGLIKYINKEVFSGFNDVQDIVGRIAIKRIIDRKQTIKSTLSGNSFLQAFAVIDDQGNVDIDSLADELKAQIREKEKIQIKIPMFGTFTFVESDVDVLLKYIREA